MPTQEQDFKPLSQVQQKSKVRPGEVINAGLGNGAFNRMSTIKKILQLESSTGSKKEKEKKWLKRYCEL